MRSGTHQEPRSRVTRVAALVLLLGLVLIPNFVLLARSGDLRHATEVLLEAMLLVTLATLAIGSWRLLLWWAFAPLLLVPSETLFVLQYGYPSTRHVLAAVSETTTGEAVEFLAGIWAPLLAATGVALLVWIGLRAWVPDHRFASRRLRLIGMGALIILLGAPEIARRSDHTPLPIRQFSWADAYPVGVPFRVAGFARATLAIHEARSAIEAFHWGATSDLERMNVVLVIGESSRPDHWQLDSYARETTPRLSARGDVVFLPNLVTPWTLTRYSVPTILTRKAPTQSEVLAESSIIAAFREAGFDTFWFANQDGLEEVSLHAREANHRRSYNLAVGRGDIDAAFDGAMLPAVKQAIKSAAPRKFIVIHTKGSHWDYHLRYPDQFRHFVPDRTANGESGKYDPRNRDLLVNAYDNSIRYTDDFLAEIIAALTEAGGPAALVYVSDHGQGLYDQGCNVFGQGNDLEAAFRTAGAIWVSPAWRQAHPDGAEALTNNARRPLTTAGTIFHTVADLGGLNISDRSSSLISRQFQLKPRVVNQIAGGHADFDRSKRIGSCRLVKPLSVLGAPSP